MHRASWVLIAGLFVAGSACAHRRAAVSDMGGPQPADSVTVNVTNHSGVPMVIFARGSGEDYRMGTVDPGKTSQFVLRFGWLWGRFVEFVAEPRGVPAGGFRSGHFNLNPGDVVDFEMTTGSSRATLRP
jgi:hypothetical protein